MLDDIIRFLEDHDSDIYARFLRDLKQDLDEPRDIVLHNDDLEALRSGRGAVNRAGVVVYYD